MKRMLSTAARVLFPCLLTVSFLTGCMPSDRSVISQANQFNDGIKPAVMTDPQLAGYLQKVGDRIITAARQSSDASNPENAWMFSNSMQFHLVNSKTVNAFTTGGEHMYIYTALFQQCQSEDELAAVMAHEFAHVYGRHVQKGMRRQYMALGAAAAAGGAGYMYGGKEKGMEYGGLALASAMAAGQFIGMSYTRGDEAEADQRGFEFYVRAGWDPKRFGDFFQRMIDMGYDKGNEMLSDHPSLKSRVDTAKKRAAEVSVSAKNYARPPVAGPAEFKRLQQLSQQVGANMPSDESLQKTQQLLAAMPRGCLTPVVHEDQKAAEQAVLKDVEAAKAAGQKKQAK